ncbi:UNVERIFIED_CONTAM: hypothetical protein PYX00_003350 [Menopon gallinae]|uniref:Uncharacterized protein n=1 Tax=Menopon gallinae TaxID=328185 RepID=A0AAW2I1M3_9NEOP
MDREVIRVLIVVSLVFLIVGDFATFFAPFLQMVGLDGEEGATAPKRQPLRTGQKDYAEDGPPDDGNGEGEILGSSSVSKSTLMATIRNSCLPKLICELNATPHKERLSESERSLFGLIKDTTLSSTAEVTSKYHFAAHMGQLIAGIEGTGCHNFYPSCPFPGLQVLQMIKKVKIR